MSKVNSKQLAAAISKRIEKAADFDYEKEWRNAVSRTFGVKKWALIGPSIYVGFAAKGVNEPLIKSFYKAASGVWGGDNCTASRYKFSNNGGLGIVRNHGDSLTDYGLYNLVTEKNGLIISTSLNAVDNVIVIYSEFEKDAQSTDVDAR